MSYQLHLFGAASPVGEAFKRSIYGSSLGFDLFVYSRYPSERCSNYFLADLTNPHDFRPAGSLCAPSVWVSFAPIWLLAPFLNAIAADNVDFLSGIAGVIACSSSSAITKRFSNNSFDKGLSIRLNDAENSLLSTCRRLGVPCKILQPSMIYGQVGNYCDSNLSRILHLLRCFPVLPVPRQSGLRQPIHVTQLAAVSLHLVQQLVGSGLDSFCPERIALGGDSTLTYTEMIKGLQQSQAPGDRSRRCRLMPISNRLFFLFSAPLLLRSPKAFEAVFRMGADLSGFTPAHKILGAEPQPFPVTPPG